MNNISNGNNHHNHNNNHININNSSNLNSKIYNIDVNNHDESSCESDESKSDSNRTRIGPEFQAIIYDSNDYKNNIELKETLLWKPNEQLDERDLDEYINISKLKYCYNIEQAICFLFLHKYDFKKAKSELQNYMPANREWTQEEKILFEHAFMFHGKNFNKIKQQFPDKTQSELVNYYYMWKKTRTHLSFIDFQLVNKNNNNNSTSNNNNNNNSSQTNSSSNNNYNSGYNLTISNEANTVALNGSSFNGYSEKNGKNDLKNGSNNSSDKEENGIDDEIISDDDDENDENDSDVAQICCNCDLITNDLQSTPKGMLCAPCYNYWKNTRGLMRPDHLIAVSNLNSNSLNHSSKNKHTNSNSNLTSTSNLMVSSIHENNSKLKSIQKALRKPPKGIYLNFEELLELCSNDSRNIFDGINRGISELKKKVQFLKQEIAEITNPLMNPSDFELPPCLIDQTIHKQTTPGWSSKEITFAILGLNKYGTDFRIISQIIGTKSESSIMAFYNYYKDQLELDKLIINNKDKVKSRVNIIINDLVKQNLPNLQVQK